MDKRGDNYGAKHKYGTHLHPADSRIGGAVFCGPFLRLAHAVAVAMLDKGIEYDKSTRDNPNHAFGSPHLHIFLANGHVDHAGELGAAAEHCGSTESFADLRGLGAGRHGPRGDQRVLLGLQGEEN